MKLTVIGATGSMSGPEGAASSYLVQAVGRDPETNEDRVWSAVFDLGPGSFGQLWRHVDPREVDAVFISHGHADHMADIISFQVFLKWNPEGQCTPLLLAGPEEIAKRAAQIDGYHEKDEFSDAFNFVPVNAGTTLQVGPMRITAFPGLHPVESYGFRVSGPSIADPATEVHLAYTGDTDLCEGMFQMANEVDLLLAECGFTEAVDVSGIHLSGKRAGILANGSRAKKLLLTHIQPWTKPAVVLDEAAGVFNGETEVVYPGLTQFL